MNGSGRVQEPRMVQEHDPGRAKKSGSGRGQLDRGLGWGGACDGARARKGQGPEIAQEPGM